MTSLWAAVAELPLTIEAVTYDTLRPGDGFGEMHDTRSVRLSGDGADGLAEDITLSMGPTPDLPLAGSWTLATFCAHLATLEQWPDGPPEWEAAHRWRNWSYESAALDLALTQAQRPLHGVLGRTPEPVVYVNSLGLGEPASADTILRRLSRYPDLRFKLDAAPDWTPEIVETLVGTGAVLSIDFKGQYELPIEDLAALVRMYELVIDAFPEALLEDPHDLPEINGLVERHADRVSYDAPIHRVADLETTPIRARTVNIKPTRIGSLRDLSDLYDACASRGLAMYGGGMGELGVARGQVQLLASLFHANAPNDIAPPGFNALEPAEGLPVSPLEPRPAPVGFRRDD